MKILETIFVITLFLIYLGLWRIKQLTLRKNTGIDPNVMAKSSSNVQIYMSHIANALTVYALIIIILHAAQIKIGSMFTGIEAISATLVDIIGFLTGLIGLSLCLYAQIKMGSSWRVGIDEKIKTELITTGLYKYIRNPTYLGLFLLNIGVWFIWPTWAVFLLNLTFFLFLEIQVRCEEDYLSLVHGVKYTEYKKRTKRYIPFVY